MTAPTCDFCGVAGAVCYFPCEPFTLVSDNPRAPKFPSGDKFYACPDCRPLVDAGRWNELRARCAQADILQSIPTHGQAALWSGFATNRKGGPIDLEPEPPAEPEAAAQDQVPPGFEAELRGAAAHWHNLIDLASAVVAACTDGEEGPAADPAKVPNATGDAVAAIEALRVVVTGPDAVANGIALHEVDEAARRVSAAFPIAIDNLIPDLLSSGGRSSEIALMGAVMMLNGALHDLDDALARLGRFDPDGEEGEG
ncbi:hypothetical protein [Actinomadura violacea]|uniref:Uncharacterized protein n=1 Tax=Actinomadura violacea TaxID=2819934 RepID=A0ABS3RYF1_9ACTN|nr:hypothetical protein [Actinomadura violacea]MBO2461732.1 hypothetical protein [Actinomadura violacea]